VRAAALGLLGAAGKNEPRVFPLISESLTRGVTERNFNLIFASSEALIALCDPKGLATLEEIGKSAKNDPQVLGFMGQIRQRLDQCLKTTPKP
jgi:hypothetical protein